MITVNYYANNSGGRWWLKDKHWFALEASGWNVEWKNKEFLGAKATSASKTFNNIREALIEFQSVTSQRVCDNGCSCCGAPHSFTWKDLESGEKEYYESGHGLLLYLEGYDE